MKLIINADDFGLSNYVNEGIIQAYKEGIVTSTTMMCNMNSSEEAAKLAKENQELGVGIHFVLTAGKALSKDCPSLLNKNGEFLKYEEIEQFATSEDIRRELNCQLDKFMSYGLKPTHIDSHHHVHRIKKVFDIVKEIAIKYNLPIRFIEEYSKEYNDVQSTDIFTEEFFDVDYISVDSLIKIINKYKDEAIVEVMCHPAISHKSLRLLSSYVDERQIELNTLISKELKEFIKKREYRINKL